MASQTGTLKFRQSDGTYTELYPKTTIAQVDGLQTQLDNINTSLQNKVGYNVIPNSSTNQTIYVGTSTYKTRLTSNVQFGVIDYINDSIYISLCFNWDGSGNDLPRIWLFNNQTKEKLSFLYKEQIQFLIDKSIGGAINSSY